MKRMKIHNFTKPELDKFRELCNFTDEELKYFNLKAKQVSNVAISIELNICSSKVSALSRTVKHKICTVLSQK